MIGIIFEVWPAQGKKQEYLDIAARLRPLLDQIDGFISIERFESLYEPERSCHFPSFEIKQQWNSGENWRRTASPKWWDAQACFVTTDCGLPA